MRIKITTRVNNNIEFLCSNCMELKYHTNEFHNLDDEIKFNKFLVEFTSEHRKC